MKTSILLIATLAILSPLKSQISKGDTETTIPITWEENGADTYKSVTLFNQQNKERSCLKQENYIKLRADSCYNLQYNETTIEWDNYHKKYYSYEGTDYLNEIINFYWDATGAEWLDNSKKEYSYSSDGFLVEELRKIWNTINEKWDNSGKYEYTYNKDGLMVEKLYINYNQSEGIWIPSLKYCYNYDDGNLVRESIYSWDSDNERWEGEISRKDYSDFSDGEWTLYNVYSWNKTVEKWDTSLQTERVLDADNNITLETTSSWESSTGEYAYNNRYEYIFEDGNCTQNFYYKYDEINGWEGDAKVEYSYNDSGYVVQLIRSKYNDTDGWVSSNRQNYTYDMAYTLNDLISNNDIDYYDGVVSDRVTYEFDTDAQEWVGKWDYLYYYTEVEIVNILPNYQKSLTCYPNPATNLLIIELADNEETIIEIIDMNGKVVLAQKINSTAQLNVGHLEKGVYLITLKGDSLNQVKKLVVQ